LSVRDGMSSMKTVLVHLNGDRVRLAGCDSANPIILAIVEYSREDDQWFTRLDVTASDKVKQEAYSWETLPFKRGDVMTLQLVEAEVVDHWELRIPLKKVGHTIPDEWQSELYSAAPPPSERIDAVCIEVNGERLWCAGVRSQEWSTITCFEHLELRGQWITSVHVIVRDKSGGVEGGWQARLLKPNDVVTLRFVEADEVDEFEVEFPSHPESG
jgi:hypothetical protein